MTGLDWENNRTGRKAVGERWLRLFAGPVVFMVVFSVRPFVSSYVCIFVCTITQGSL